MQTKKTIQKTFLLLIFIVAGFLLQSCYVGSNNIIKGDGNVLTTTHQLEHFKIINITGMYDVKLLAGQEAVVVLETDKNIQDLTEIKVKNNTLYISSLEEGVYRPTKMEMHITYPDLEQIMIGGACKLQSETTVSSETLLIDIGGAADITMELDVEELITKIAGAANIFYEGRASFHQATLSGASNMRAENLLTRETRINLSGAGSAHVHASRRLHAILSGVGSIRYYGNPAEIITERSGLGNIRSAE